MTYREDTPAGDKSGHPQSLSSDNTPYAPVSALIGSLTRIYPSTHALSPHGGFLLHTSVLTRDKTRSTQSCPGHKDTHAVYRNTPRLPTP